MSLFVNMPTGLVLLRDLSLDDARALMKDLGDQLSSVERDRHALDMRDAYLFDRVLPEPFVPPALLVVDTVRDAHLAVISLTASLDAAKSALRMHRANSTDIYAIKRETEASTYAAVLQDIVAVRQGFVARMLGYG